MKDNQKELNELIQNVMEEMQKRKYGKKILTHYRSSFHLLMSISHDTGEVLLSERLIEAFLNSPVNCSEKWREKERIHRQRCIQLLLSLAETGTVDWGRQSTQGIAGELKDETFRLELERFVSYLEQEGFSSNTICGYRRLVTYFLLFCQKNGYKKLSDIRTDDVSTFIASLYKDGRYRPTTIGGSLSGLRMFLSRNDDTLRFQLEIPVHLPQETKIMEVYDDTELAAIEALLSSGMPTKRDTAICRLLLETGLRGVDVCSLKLEDIDWRKDVIYIIQSKTKKQLFLPLKASYGNAIADYLLNERPQGMSDHVFLKTTAPFGQLGTGSIYEILKKMEKLAGIQKKGRPVGSRVTRHNAASSMLRAGIPMSDISAALGHKDPNIVSVYLSTDAHSLAACMLPLPPAQKGGAHDEK